MKKQTKERLVQLRAQLLVESCDNMELVPLIECIEKLLDEATHLTKIDSSGTLRT